MTSSTGKLYERILKNRIKREATEVEKLSEFKTRATLREQGIYTKISNR